MRLTFNEVELVLIICSIVDVLQQQSLSLLALRYLCAYSSEVLNKQLSCFCHENQGFLAHILAVFIRVDDRSYSVHRQSHEFT